MNEVMRKTNQTPIEIVLGVDEYGRTTAKKLYEFLELNPKNYSRWCETNILNNKFAEEGNDYEVFFPKEENILGGRPTQDFKLTAAFAKKLSMTAKNEKGEQAREYFVRVEDGAKKLTSKIQELSPQLQVLINMELKQKELESEIASTKQEIQSMRDVITINPNGWRKETSTIINKIALKAGGYEHIKLIRDEIYKTLNQRLGVDVQTRLTYKRRRMADDKKLIEGYVAIVKEMAIKSGVA